MEIIMQPVGGEQLDATGTMYPSYLRVVTGREHLADHTATFYGYVMSGTAHLESEGFQLDGSSGTYFCWPSELTIETTGITIVMCRLGFRGLLCAGRIESTGRLAYIDGCSSSVLVGPPRVGDPILNFLHFPRGTRQTEHTHPSLRLGIVARGSGVVIGPRWPGGPRWEKSIGQGAVFLLPAHERHAFLTAPDQTMDVISYHPDSDWGPDDHSHPMLTRTYLSNKPLEPEDFVRIPDVADR